MLILFQLLALFLVLCVVLGQRELVPYHTYIVSPPTKICNKIFLLPLKYFAILIATSKDTHCWHVIITAWIVNFMKFCFILMMHNVKAFNCYSFRNFTFKGNFSSEIFKVGFSEASAVKVNRGLLNIEGEKLLLNFNVVVISLILNKTKTN